MIDWSLVVLLGVFLVAWALSIWRLSALASKALSSHEQVAELMDLAREDAIEERNQYLSHIENLVQTIAAQSDKSFSAAMAISDHQRERMRIENEGRALLRDDKPAPSISVIPQPAVNEDVGITVPFGDDQVGR